MQYHQTNQAMNIPAEFDDIRPYNPDELQGICEELIADPDFRKAIESVMPGVPVEALAAQLKQCKTSLDIQKTFSTNCFIRLSVSIAMVSNWMLRN